MILDIILIIAFKIAGAIVFALNSILTFSLSFSSLANAQEWVFETAVRFNILFPVTVLLQALYFILVIEFISLTFKSVLFIYTLTRNKFMTYTSV